MDPTSSFSKWLCSDPNNNCWIVYPCPTVYNEPLLLNSYIFCSVIFGLFCPIPLVYLSFYAPALCFSYWDFWVYFNESDCLFVTFFWSLLSVLVCVYFLIWTLELIHLLKRGGGRTPKKIYRNFYWNLIKFINLEKIGTSNNDKCFYLRTYLSICSSYFVSSVLS